MYHTLLAFSPFNKAWLCRQTHRDAKCTCTSCVTEDTDNTDHTNRYVGKGTADKRCPDVFGVRVPNNGRVLAAAISHQVVHVALPGHICEISSKIKKIRRAKVGHKRLLGDQKTAKKLFYQRFNGPPASKTPPAL